MKHFGTVKSFDQETGRGAITPETGGDELSFERSAFSLEPKSAPRAGLRLSYDLAHTNGEPRAINLAGL